MSTWLASLFQTKSPLPCLDVQIRRRDTILLQCQIQPSHTFSIGSSPLNPLPIETPSLPMAQFTLIHFHTKGPLIQFTSTMHGILQQNKQFLSLDELKQTPHIHPTLQGYRLLLPPDATLTLHLDQLFFSIRWASHQHPFASSPLSLPFLHAHFPQTSFCRQSFQPQHPSRVVPL